MHVNHNPILHLAFVFHTVVFYIIKHEQDIDHICRQYSTQFAQLEKTDKGLP